MIAFALLAAAVQSSSPLDPLTARMDDVVFLEADFVQRDYWALTMEWETSTGHLLLAAPNLFRLEYTDPEGRMMGFDGEQVFTIEPSTRQVILTGEGEPSSFMTFLDLGSDESVVLESETSGDTVTVSLGGDLGEGITGMDVAFCSSDSLPLYLATVDANGNRTSWSLSHASVSRTCDPGAFEMALPAGYQLVRPGDI
jgi:outer membrane lipoprotein-sorting protein